MMHLFLPDWAVPKRYEAEGFFAKVDSIAELARKINANAAGLEYSVRKMNEYARISANRPASSTIAGACQVQFVCRVDKRAKSYSLTG